MLDSGPLHIDYKATETSQAFHASDATVRCLMGPVGSGKSSACCMEILRRAMTQQPGPNGIRYSRWVIVRNTYPELQSTTIKDWTEWFPEEHFGRVYQSSPIEQVIEFGDVHLTIWFISLDNERDAKKFRGLRITGVWLNECSELPRVALDMALQRKGRYPDKARGRPSWSGVIMDTNPPDEDHWIYKLFEEEKPHDFEMFKYAEAMIKTDKGYKPNPEADYLQNLPDPNYYNTLINGQSENWIRVFVQGKYGSVSQGRLVYPDYNDKLHCVESIEPIPTLPLMLSWDFGLTPACVLTQKMPNGQVRILREFQGEDVGTESFAEFTVLPWLQENLPSSIYTNWHEGQADPAGKTKEGDDLSCIGRLNNLSSLHPAFETNHQGAWSNSPDSRINAVSLSLKRLIDGHPGLIIDSSCKMLRRGFNGQYYYKRVLSAGGNKYKDKPEKNIYSHLHDALQYACLEYNYIPNDSQAAQVNSFISSLASSAPNLAIGGAR